MCICLIELPSNIVVPVKTQSTIDTHRQTNPTDATHEHVHNVHVHTQHTSHYIARAGAEEENLEDLAYLGKAQWCVYTCVFHYHT